VEKQLRLSAQFLHNELPVRLAHRVAELENLPYGLSAKPHVLKVSQIRRPSDISSTQRCLMCTQKLSRQECCFVAGETRRARSASTHSFVQLWSTILGLISISISAAAAAILSLYKIGYPQQGQAWHRYGTGT
jgi:hypothetical protein